jgi:hypothetical protein
MWITESQVVRFLISVVSTALSLSVVATEMFPGPSAWLGPALTPARPANAATTTAADAAIPAHAGRLIRRRRNSPDRQRRQSRLRAPWRIGFST